MDAWRATASRCGPAPVRITSTRHARIARPGRYWRQDRDTADPMSDLPVEGEALDDALESAEPNECVRCHKAQSDGLCCSSHLKQLCHRCYRVTHFVEVCGCETCIEQGIPRIYPEPKTEATA